MDHSPSQIEDRGRHHDPKVPRNLRCCLFCIRIFGVVICSNRSILKPSSAPRTAAVVHQRTGLTPFIARLAERSWKRLGLLDHGVSIARSISCLGSVYSPSWRCLFALCLFALCLFALCLFALCHRSDALHGQDSDIIIDWALGKVASCFEQRLTQYVGCYGSITAQQC